MNELTVKRFGGVAAAESYKAGLLAIRDHVAGDSDGRDILKLSEDGEWTFGQNDTPLSKKDLLAVNPASFRHGYVAFDDNGRAEDVDGNIAEYLRPMGVQLPFVEDLPELAEPKSKRAKRRPRWQFQIAIDLVVIEGPNQGAELVYKPTSNGGLRACRVIGEEIARRIGETEELVPVVELLSDFYYNKTWGKDVAFPVIEIVEWKDVSDGEFASKSGAEKPKKDERTRKGDKVDGRRRRDDDEDEAPRKGARAGRRRRDDEVEDRPARARRRDDEVDDQDEEGEPRRTKRDMAADAPAERKRARHEDPVDDDDRPRRRVRADDVVDEPKPAERRARRGRDDDSDEAKPAPRERNRRDEDDEDDRPRTRRAADDDREDKRPAGPRGRNAAAGRRR